MYDIITIGSATRDVFLTSHSMHRHRASDVLTHLETCLPFGAKLDAEKIFFSTGGGATNSAVTFARLGKFKTAALCRIGPDSAGQDILKSLRGEKINTQFVQTASDKELTGYSAILSVGDASGERSIVVYRGASQKIEHQKISWQKLKTKWFYISSLGGDLALLKKILTHAKKIGARVAFNPGGQELKKSTEIKPLLRKLDFLILNREEAARLMDKPMKNTHVLLKALQKLATVNIMTDGMAGAYAVTKDGAYFVPSTGHKAKNRTGAGDAFGSGFLTGWIKSEGCVETALRLGTLNADGVIQKFGAKTGILSKYPSEKLLKSLKIKEVKL